MTSEQSKANSHYISDNTELLFLTYLFENYKLQKGINGKKTDELFRKYNLYDFVYEQFFPLHIEGPRANEIFIDEEITRKGGTPLKRVLGEGYI